MPNRLLWTGRLTHDLYPNGYFYSSGNATNMIGRYDVNEYSMVRNNEGRI